MTTDKRGPLGSECNAELGPIPEGDRFKDTLKFRRLGIGEGEALYECWGDAVRAYAAAEVAKAVAAERERWRALLEARAAGCERAAENTEDPKFDAMARVLMSVREDGSRA